MNAPSTESKAVRLHPKEHGAYAILGVPLVAALILSGLNVVSALTVIATVAGFLANEPLLVCLGQRGKRAQLATPAAGKRLLVLLVIVVTAGSMAFWFASVQVRIALAGCVLFAVAGFVVSAAGSQRTLGGQLTGIVGLTLPTTVVLLAGGMDIDLTLRLSSAWILGRIATTVSVKSMVAQHRIATEHRVPWVNDAILVLALTTCTTGLLFGLSEWVLVTPLAACAIYLRLRPPAVKQLRNVGWTLLTMNLACALWMIVWCKAGWGIS